jgi:hypothetical protein
MAKAAAPMARRGYTPCCAAAAAELVVAGSSGRCVRRDYAAWPRRCRAVRVAKGGSGGSQVPRPSARCSTDGRCS